VSSATAPGVTLSGTTATIAGSNTFSPVPGDSGFSAGDLFGAGDGQPLVITVTSPAASRFQRYRMLYVGAIRIQAFGTQGSISTRLIDLTLSPDWYDIGEWVQAMTGAEYIQRLEISRNGSTSFGLFGVDNIELASAP
jgi:hypothetical protein